MTPIIHIIRIEWEPQLVRAVITNRVIAHIARHGRTDAELKLLLAAELQSFLMNEFNPESLYQ
jgi:hypothetical protein